jgi:uncharacterized membrane protein YhaH (DUF805 family)
MPKWLGWISMFGCFVLICIFTAGLWSYSYASTEVKPEKTVEVKDYSVTANIDAGDNINSLIEKLAKQIGTTTDKIFPWYVKQNLITGYTHAIVILVLFISSIVVLMLTWHKADFNSDKCFLECLITILSIIFIITLIAVTAGMASDIMNQIFNPEYGATQDIIKSISHMVCK